MEYKKIINLSDNTQNQLFKFRRKTWTEISDDSLVTYNPNGQIKFKTSILKTSLCNYSDAYILVRGTINVVAAGTDNVTTVADRKNKQAIVKNCAPFNLKYLK